MYAALVQPMISGGTEVIIGVADGRVRILPAQPADPYLRRLG